jgi:hypothetical protein
MYAVERDRQKRHIDTFEVGPFDDHGCITAWVWYAMNVDMRSK